MLDKLKERIKDRKLILIGEIHGTKEIPELLSQFFSELANEEEFNVCFEIPDEYQNKMEDFFKNKEIDDGKNSKGYFDLIEKLKKLSIKIIFVAPSKIKNQEDFEAKIAENIRKVFDGKKIFVILGDVHASKNPLSFGEIKIKTAGSILFKEFHEDFFNVRIVLKSGKFFNFGIKEVDEDFLDEEFNKNFDYVYEIDEVTARNFLFKN